MKTYTLLLSSVFLLVSCGSNPTDTTTSTQTQKSPVTVSSSSTSAQGPQSVNPATVDASNLTTPSTTGSTIRPR